MVRRLNHLFALGESSITTESEMERRRIAVNDILLSLRYVGGSDACPSVIELEEFDSVQVDTSTPEPPALPTDLTERQLDNPLE